MTDPWWEDFLEEEPLHVLHWKEALAEGLTRAELRSRKWTRSFRGVYVEGAARGERRATFAAALAAAGPASALSHLSAADLWGFPLPMRKSGLDPVHVTVDRPHEPRQRQRLKIHHSSLGPGCLDVIDGLAVTSPTRTWLDCAAAMGRADFVALTDAALRSGRVTHDGLHRTARAADGRRGIRLARRAIVEADARAESPWETHLRLLLLDAGLPVVPQVVILGTGKRFLARVDLALVEAKIAIEYEGAHHYSPDQQRRDWIRINALHRANWLVLRYTAAQVLNEPLEIVAEVRDAAAHRCPPGTVRRAK